jgi:hypothetical protein
MVEPGGLVDAEEDDAVSGAASGRLLDRIKTAD